MIYQLLSSLYYLSKDLSPDSKPAAVLIATYLDQLKDLGDEEEKKIDEISDSLNKLFKKVEFHSQGFLIYPTEGKATVFVPVNNYSGDEEEIHRPQAFLKVRFLVRSYSMSVASLAALCLQLSILLTFSSTLRF